MSIENTIARNEGSFLSMNSVILNTKSNHEMDRNAEYGEVSQMDEEGLRRSETERGRNPDAIMLLSRGLLK
jgi:hypothetical protein